MTQVSLGGWSGAARATKQVLETPCHGVSRVSDGEQRRTPFSMTVDEGQGLCTQIHDPSLSIRVGHVQDKPVGATGKPPVDNIGSPCVQELFVIVSFLVPRHNTNSNCSSGRNDVSSQGPKERTLARVVVRRVEVGALVILRLVLAVGQEFAAKPRACRSPAVTVARAHTHHMHTHTHTHAHRTHTGHTPDTSALLDVRGGGGGGGVCPWFSAHAVLSIAGSWRTWA